MSNTIQNLTTAQITALRFTAWSEPDQEWSQPISYAEAQELAAREPGLQVRAILPGGATTEAAPFADIFAYVRQREEDAEIEARREAKRKRLEREIQERQQRDKSTLDGMSLRDREAILTHRLIRYTTYTALTISGASLIISAILAKSAPLGILGATILIATAVIRTATVK